jgi:hypothetical protein
MFDADMSIDTGHSHAALCEGFHEDEETHRWTDGLGRIPDRWIGNFAVAFTLELLLSPSGLRYLLAPAVAEPAEAAAALADEPPAAAPKKRRATARRNRAQRRSALSGRRDRGGDGAQARRLVELQ